MFTEKSKYPIQTNKAKVIELRRRIDTYLHCRDFQPIKITNSEAPPLFIESCR